MTISGIVWIFSSPKRQVLTNQSPHIYLFELFLSTFEFQPISVEIVLVVDHCVKTWSCSQRLTFNGLSTSALVDGPLVLGIPSSNANLLQELCLENIVINSQVFHQNSALYLPNTCAKVVY